MAFTVSDFQDLLLLLRQNPEWVAQLRELIVADDFRKIEAALDRLAEELRETRRDFDERMRAFDERMKAADGRMARIEASIGDLVLAQRKTEFHLQRLDTRVGHFSGFLTEERLRRNAAGYFGRHLRRAQVLAPSQLPRLRTANESGKISDEDWAQINQVDFVVRGFENAPGAADHEVVYAVEASSVVDLHDVNRSVGRSEILTSVGYDGRPAVGGARILAEARDLATRLNVLVVLNPELDPQAAAD